MHVVVGEGRLPGKASDWSGNLIGQMVDVLNPFRLHEDGSPLKCAVVNVPVKRGLVQIRETVAAETDKVAGSVADSVNLGAETLDLILHSQTTGIRPGLADYASAGKLTGTLRKPELAANAKGTAAVGLRIGAAVASAGITLLAESAVRKAVPAHPCRAALAGETTGNERGFLGRLEAK